LAQSEQRIYILLIFATTTTKKTIMKKFDSVHKYLESAKVGDLVALGGLGIVNGLGNLEFRSEVFKVCEVSQKNGLVLKSYRGRTRLRIYESFYGQQVGVLTSAEFKKLSK
jgi:hypothetical protein